MADVRGASGAPLAAAFALGTTPSVSTPVYVNTDRGDLWVSLAGTPTLVSSTDITRQSPRYYGGIPLSENASFDSTTAIQAAIDYYATINTSELNGTSATIDLGGLAWLVSSTLILRTTESIRFVNGLLRAKTTGWASAVTPMIQVATTGANAKIEDVILDCSKVCSGIELLGGRSVVINPTIFHMGDSTSAFGVKFNSLADCGVVGGNIQQWFSGDSEYNTQANWKARGIDVQVNDCFVTDTVVRYCGINVNLGASANTFTYTGGHLYNGGPSSGGTPQPFVSTKNIVAANGANSEWNGVYLDNGNIDLSSPGHAFYNCRALYNSANVTLTWWIKLIANAAGANPRQFKCANWVISSDALTNGTVPLLTFADDGANTWDGDYDFMQVSGQLHEATDLVIATKTQVNTDPSIIYYSPGGTGNPAFVAVADNTTVDMTTVGGMKSRGDYSFMHHGIFGSGAGLSANTSIAAIDYAGCHASVTNGGSNITVTLPADAPAKWYALFTRLGAGTVAFAAAAGAAISVNGVAATSPVIAWQYGMVLVTCFRNTGGAAAEYSIMGDVSLVELVASGLTAAGTTQGTALAITASLNTLTTVAANTGVVLYSSQRLGTSQAVYNGGANAVNVYPPTSGTINQLAANVAVILPVNTAATFTRATSTLWIGSLSA